MPVPSRATGYRHLTELSKGRHAFGSAKQRRSVAERPQGVFGRLRATRPGEYVVLDTTPLDVFAMEPVTLRWVPVELTVAMDLLTRCVLGLRLTPVSTKSQDVANVLFQCVTVQHSPTALPGEDGPAWPFHGVPRNLLVRTEEPDGVSQQRVGGLPACVPEAIVVDHGKQYLSNHVIGVCARMGITVQPAIPHKATDKPNVERFFRTLRESLLQHLPAYKGRTSTPAAATSRTGRSTTSPSSSRSSASGSAASITTPSTTDCVSRSCRGRRSRRRRCSRSASPAPARSPCRPGKG